MIAQELLDSRVAHRSRERLEALNLNAWQAQKIARLGMENERILRENALLLAALASAGVPLPEGIRK